MTNRHSLFSVGFVYVFVGLIFQARAQTSSDNIQVQPSRPNVMPERSLNENRTNIVMPHTIVNRPDTNLIPLNQITQTTDATAVKIRDKIQKAITKQKQLSLNARRVIVVTTKDNLVHLRGVVDSTNEWNIIQNIARQHAGSYRVTNELILNRDINPKPENPR